MPQTSTILSHLNTLFLAKDEPIFQLSGDFVVARLAGIELSSVFQPIVETRDSHVIGWEGLVRPARLSDHAILSPAEFFALFESGPELIRADRICRALHLANHLRSESQEGYLFLNLHPRHLLSVNGEFGRNFSQLVRVLGMKPEQIVLEVLEHAIHDESLLQRAVREFKHHGFLIALDDFEAQSDPLLVDRLFALKPHIVKFGRSFLQPRYQIILPKLFAAVRELGALALSEGIETPEEKHYAANAGAMLMQGYLLGRPEVRNSHPIPRTA